jgi:small subunit ribosomal protein S18
MAFGRSGSFKGKKKKKKFKKSSFRKKRPPATLKFNYRDLGSVASFLTEEGKIVPARVSGLSAQQQRSLTQAVKIARDLAFISPQRKIFLG